MISFDEAKMEWVLTSGPICYVMALNWMNELRHRYLGPIDRRCDADDPRYNEGAPEGDVDSWEYPGRGPMVFQETVLAVNFGPSDRDLQLEYSGHEIDPIEKGGKLRIRLKDRYHPLTVDLFYEAAGDCGVFRRWGVIRNDGEGPLELEEAGSFAFYRPPGQYTLHHLAGTWADEINPIEEALRPGRKVLESRRGYTGHVHQPWFALTEGASSFTVFGALEWSGNWKLTFDCDVAGRVSVTGGMSDFDFTHILGGGESLTTPTAVLGAAPGGLDDAARSLHTYVRQFVLPRRQSETPLPVVFDPWYILFGRDLSAKRITDLARNAASIGVEVFNVPAGWQSEEGVWSHEGDWRPSPAIFPEGLEKVTRAARGMGLKLGVFVEIDAASEDSDVYREHPDWVFQSKVPGPQPRGDTLIHRFVLNLGRQDVYEHLKEEITDLIGKFHFDYLQNDANRPLSDIGDPSGVSGAGRNLIWRHINNYYRLLDELRARFPDLIILNCAGGGGRLDFGILRRTDTVWISDNVDPLYRLSMFISGTSFLPPEILQGWVTDWPSREPLTWHPGQTDSNRPHPDLDFQFRVCMMGHLGVGSDIERWPPEWVARAKHHITRYKEIRGIIQSGVLYRLTPPPRRDGKSEWAAVAFVSPDCGRALVFCYRLASEGDTLRLQVPGLKPDSSYDIENDDSEEHRQLMGREIRERGIEVTVQSRYSSALLLLKCLE